MKLIDPSVQKASLAIQCVCFGFLNFITFGNVKQLNNSYEEVKRSFAEVPSSSNL